MAGTPEYPAIVSPVVPGYAIQPMTAPQTVPVGAAVMLFDFQCNQNWGMRRFTFQTGSANGISSFYVTSRAAQGGLDVPWISGSGLSSGSYTTPPNSLTISTASTGGTLSASTTYSYEVTAVNSLGFETNVSSSDSVTTGLSSTNTATIGWAASPGAVSYNVYGRTSTSYLKIANTIALTYTDTGNITPAGSPPATNQTFISSNRLNPASPGYVFPITAGLTFQLILDCSGADAISFWAGATGTATTLAVEMAYRSTLGVNM